VNDLTDPALVDRLTGTAALNSVPVRVEAATASAPDGISAEATWAC
jgi:hypothetical protein